MSAKNSFTLKAIGKRIASLKLTVALFAMSLFMVLVATLVQREVSSFDAKSEYITKAFIFVDWQVFFPSHFELEGGFYFPGGMVLGALLLINLLAAHAFRFKLKTNAKNGFIAILLLFVGSAMIVAAFSGTIIKEFYPQLFYSFIGTLLLIPSTYLLFAKRGGVVLLHAGIVVLLLSELGTWYFQHEANMSIEEGSFAHYTENSREFELVFVKSLEKNSDADSTEKLDTEETHEEVQEETEVETASKRPGEEKKKNKEVVLPYAFLRGVRPEAMPLPLNTEEAETQKGKPESGPFIRDSVLPVSLRIDRWFTNALPKGAQLENRAKPLEQNTENLATTGYGIDLPLCILPRATDGSTSITQTNFATCYVTLWPKDAAEKDEPLGTWLLGSFYSAYGLKPQTIEVDGQTYEISLRHKREYKDFAFHLDKVTHDIFVGTNRPKNFQSDIRIQPVLGQKKDEDSWRLAKIFMNNPLRYQGETFYQYQMSAGEGRTTLQVVRNPVWGAPYVSCIMMGVGMAMHFTIILMNFIRKQMS